LISFIIGVLRDTYNMVSFPAFPHMPWSLCAWVVCGRLGAKTRDKMCESWNHILLLVFDRVEDLRSPLDKLLPKPSRSRYLSELYRSILQLLDLLLSHHSVTTTEELVQSYG
jgi:hypothetical protein